MAYTFGQLINLWVKNGGTITWAPLMAGIALSESSGNPKAAYTTTTGGDVSGPPYPASGEGATGLWQIEWPLHNSLLSQVNHGTTSRAALSTPNVNAKMAVQLFGKNGSGIGNWKTDGTWKQWMGHGAPQKPSASIVAGWLKAIGETSTLKGQGTAGAVAGGGAVATTTPTGTRTVSNAKTPHNPTGPACLVKLPNPFPFTSGNWCILSPSQGKWWKGAICIVGGSIVGTLGVLAIVASGFGSTKAARAASTITSALPGPVRAPARAINASRTRRAAQQRTTEQHRSRLATEETQRQATESRATTARYRAATERQHEQRMFGQKATARGPRPPRTHSGTETPGTRRAHARTRELVRQ
jgi:hypothetical protein